MPYQVIDDRGNLISQHATELEAQDYAKRFPRATVRKIYLLQLYTDYEAQIGAPISIIVPKHKPRWVVVQHMRPRAPCIISHHRSYRAAQRALRTRHRQEVYMYYGLIMDTYDQRDQLGVMQITTRT